jgi:hypothetical protein
MRTLQVALILAAISLTTACTELGYVQKKDYDTVQTKLTETENKLKEADKKLAETQAHHYTHFQLGSRTWRMDSVTGSTCILLATDADWKKPGMQTRSCDCEDFTRDIKPPYDEGYLKGQKMFCGW